MNAPQYIFEASTKPSLPWHEVPLIRATDESVKPYGCLVDDPAGFDIVVNATPLGMREGDSMPVDTGRIDPSALVGEVVLTTEETPFLAAAKARGCATQVGTDMLFEQIPAYLDFFGYPEATAEELRALAKIEY